MQKKLCLGLGVVLFFAAALLYFNGSTSEFDLRPVGVSEAATVHGGGYAGFGVVMSSHCAPIDGSTPVGCTGTTLIFTGTGRLKQANEQFCGGNCGDHWTGSTDGGE